MTHRPTTDSPSPQSRATDPIKDPVSNTRLATSRRHSGVKRRRVPITDTSLSAGTHTRLTKCQQHKPNPTEYYYRRTFTTRDQVYTGVATWIEDFYNRRRIHTSLGGTSPIEYELHQAAWTKAA